MITNLRLYFQSNSGKGCGSVDVFPVHHWWYVRQNQGLSVDEPVQNVFLKGREVVGDLLPLADGEAIAAMREDDWKELFLIVEEVAMIHVRDGNFVLLPCRCTVEEEQPINLNT